LVIGKLGRAEPVGDFVGVRRGFWDGREDMFDHCAACDDGEPFEQPLPARGPSGQVEVVGDFVGVVPEISEQPL